MTVVTQPRERAVPCAVCAAPTWAPSGRCERHVLRTFDSILVGKIAQVITRCSVATRVRISADIDHRFEIHPPQDVGLFTHPETRRRHAIALLGVAEIIQEHTRASDGTTLAALASISDQYTFTPRHREEIAAA